MKYPQVGREGGSGGREKLLGVELKMIIRGWWERTEPERCDREKERERVQHKACKFLPDLLSCLLALTLAHECYLRAAPPSSALWLYDAITVSHDNIHPINRLYAISQPIHSSNVIRLITGWLHKEDDLTVETHTDKDKGEGCVEGMMKAHLIREPIPYDEGTNVSSSQW